MFQPFLKSVLLQLSAATVGVLLAALFFGLRGAASAFAGSLAIVVPTFLFAWRLAIAARRPGSHVSAFFIGEAVKIGSAIGILFLVRLLWPEAHWGAVVMGLIITLQANFLALLVKH